MKKILLVILMLPCLMACKSSEGKNNIIKELAFQEVGDIGSFAEKYPFLKEDLYEKNDSVIDGGTGEEILQADIKNQNDKLLLVYYQTKKFCGSRGCSLSIFQTAEGSVYKLVEIISTHLPIYYAVCNDVPSFFFNVSVATSAGFKKSISKWELKKGQIELTNRYSTLNEANIDCN